MPSKENSPRISTSPTETAGPSQTGNNEASQVRLSIDEWEKKGPGSKHETTASPTTIVPDSVAPLGPKPKKAAAQDIKGATRRASTEAPGRSPGKEKEQPKPTDRVTQARVWLRKAKTHLSESRNLKTDLKAGITLAVEELYKLVKEEAMERKKGSAARKEKDITYIMENSEKGTMTEGEVKSSGKEMLKILERQSQKIDDTYIEMEKMRVAITALQRTPPMPMTYAEATSAPTNLKNKREPALHSILIAPKHGNDTSEHVLERVRKAVNAKDGWVTIDRVRKAKDRKVIVGCKTKEEREKIKERLKSVEDHLLVEEVKNQDPMMVLKDVLAIHSDEDILTALRNQNGAVFRGLDKQEDRVIIRYRKRARNPHTRHVVIRVSPIIYNRIMHTETVHIDMQRVRVADQSPLVQCSMCLGYGHGRRFCKEKEPKCSHCGGLHLKETCPDWIAGVPPSCINCTRNKLEDTEHNAFSERCPIRRRWETLARAKIEYC